MTTADTIHAPSSHKYEVAEKLSRFATKAIARWSLHRTRRILSGLDEHTLKDIGAPAVDRAASSADPRVLWYLETLR